MTMLLSFILIALSFCFISDDKGASWKSDQAGMPPKYTFQVIEKDNTLLAGQWDGVYIKRGLQGWALSNQGSPGIFRSWSWLSAGTPLLQEALNGRGELYNIMGA